MEEDRKIESIKIFSFLHIKIFSREVINLLVDKGTNLTSRILELVTHLSN